MQVQTNRPRRLVTISIRCCVHTAHASSARSRPVSCHPSLTRPSRMLKPRADTLYIYIYIYAYLHIYVHIYVHIYTFAGPRRAFASCRLQLHECSSAATIASVPGDIALDRRAAACPRRFQSCAACIDILYMFTYVIYIYIYIYMPVS